VIHVTSQMGRVGAERRTVYCMTKHAIEGLTKAMGVELAPENIRVNAIAPGATLTPLMEHYISLQDDPVAFRQKIESDSPLPGLVSAESVVRTALFLASDDASWITGVVLPVDGGVTAGR